MVFINSVIAGTGFASILLAVAELCKHKKHAIEYVSSALYFVFGCGLIVDQVNYSRYFADFPHFAYLNDFLEVLGGVLLFFYLRALFEKNVQIPRKEAVLFIPPALVLVAYIPFYIQPGQFKFEQYPIHNMQSFFLSDLYRFINRYTESWILLLVILFVFRLIILNKKKDTRLKYFNPFQISIILLYCLAWVLTTVVFIYNNIKPDYGRQRLIMLVWSLLGCVLVCIRFFFDSLTYMSRKKINESYWLSRLSKKEKEQLTQRIRKLMSVDKLYQDPDLTLADLSKELQCSQHLLSELLNNELNSSFTSFVNKYRINSAQELLRTKRSMDILSIAFECGFNSKTAFNTNFKKSCGMTPSEYRSKNLIEPE